jgi:hypothetical protein
MLTQSVEYQNKPKAVPFTELSDRERAEKLIRLLDEWMNDESGYDEGTWHELKESLNQERDNISARRLFNE